MRPSYRCLLAVLLAGITTACVAPADEESGEGADAVSVARAELGPMAEKAKQLADSLGRAGFRAGAPSALPLPGEIPSAAFTSWKVAGVVDAEKTFLGYMLLPQRGAPAGAFAVVLVDTKLKVVALSAYVPDSAKDAAKTAQAVLDGVSADAAALASSDTSGGVTTQGIGTRIVEEGIELAVRLLTGLGKGKVASKAVQRAEAHLAPKVESTVWRQFELFVTERAAIGKLLADIASHRLAFGNRRVVVVELSEAGADSSGKVLALLQKRFGSDTKKVALALRNTGDNAEAILWAIRNDVPFVLSTPNAMSPARAIDDASRLSRLSGDQRSEVLDAMENPKKLALVRVVSVDGAVGANLPVEHQEFVPLWTMADEALGVRFSGQKESGFFPWLQRFEISTTASL